jgi:hypothetical protein
MEAELNLAGFKVMAADTAEKQTMLHTLPPRTVTRIVRPDNTYYIYADPDLCACLYVGRAQEYDHLTRLGAERQISDEQLLANEAAQNQAAGWGPVGAWGHRGLGGGRLQRHGLFRRDGSGSRGLRCRRLGRGLHETVVGSLVTTAAILRTAGFLASAVCDARLDYGKRVFPLIDQALVQYRGAVAKRIIPC